MDNSEQLLAQLRDIHLPAAIQAWPGAPMRYVTLAVILSLILIVAFLFLQYKQKQKCRANFLAQLQALQTAGNFAEISTLLKRIAIYKYPKENVGSLKGESWLAFLDRTNTKNAEPKFQSKIGRLLLELPYQTSLLPQIESSSQRKLGSTSSTVRLDPSFRWDDEINKKITVLNKIIENWLLKNYNF